MDNSLALMVDALNLTISITMPVLVAVSACAFVLSVVQAVTSVQEQTMQFILKVAVFFVVFQQTGLVYWHQLEVFFDRILKLIRYV